MIGISFKQDGSNILLLNVYMPNDFQTGEAIDCYNQSLALLDVIIGEQNVNHIIIMGDFNADPKKGRFWKLLNDFTSLLSLTILNNHFPSETFIYLRHTNTTSWLDHVCSKNLIDKIKNLLVDYQTDLYGQLPISFFLDIPIYVSNSIDNERMIIKYIKWDKMTLTDKQVISEIIDKELLNHKMLDSILFTCYDVNCKCVSHFNQMSDRVNSIKFNLNKFTNKFRVANNRRFKVVPGWNDFVKKHHSYAGRHFFYYGKITVDHAMEFIMII